MVDFSASDVLAITALFVSLAALLTTVLQVLQQYLASAEGFRRCAPSVIGLWSRGTHRKFRRRELRFEVVFQTPVIFLAPPDNKRGPIKERDIVNVEGTPESYKATNILVPEAERQTQISTASDDERASWVILLGALQREEAEGRAWEKSHMVSQIGQKLEPPKHTICHQIQKKTRSFDFMPPAVTKPYATTTISHLVEMVGMLGMYWKAFEDVRGNIRAEGNGFILTSTLAQGLGLLCTFSVTGPSRFQENRVVPCHEVKELVFGCVPCILGNHLDLGNVERAKETLSTLKCEQSVIALYQSRKDRKNMFSVTFELIAMLAEPFRLRHSNLKMLPNPTADRWYGDMCVIRWTDEMKRYQEGLADVVAKANEATEETASHSLISTIFDQWAKMKQVWVATIDLDMRERVHDALDATAALLQDSQEFSSLEVMSVVTSHISVVLAATDELQATIHATCTDEKEENGKLMKYYFEKVLPSVANNGGNLSDDAKNKRTVIWLSLMFRMICWFLLHDFDKNDINRMDSALKGSRMPVFIG